MRAYLREGPLGTDLGSDRAGALGGLALALLGGADQDRDLAEMPVVAEELMRLRHLLEAHRLPQDRSHLGLLDQLICLGRLPRMGEVRADDLLLTHPQVPDIEVELVARGGTADHDLSERPDREHRGGERGLADGLEHAVGGLAQDRLDRLAEPPRLLEPGPFLFYGLVAAAHHAGE